MASRLPLVVFGVDFPVHASGGSRFVSIDSKKKAGPFFLAFQVEPGLILSVSSK